MNERRVERVARAMCWAMGHNPDQQVMRFPVPAHGAKDRVLLDGDFNRPISSWTLYCCEAYAAVKALESCLTPEYDSTRDQKREDAFVELD